MAYPAIPWNAVRCWLFVGLGLVSAGAAAQQPSTFQPSTCSALTVLSPKPAAGAAATPFKSPVPTIYFEGKPAPIIGLNDLIVLRFTKVDANLIKCLEASDLTLYLDHIPMTGLSPIERMGNNGEWIDIKYRLMRPLGSPGQGWKELMAKAWQAGKAFPVTVGLGTAGNEFAFADESLRIELGNGKSCWAIGALIASIAALICLWAGTKLLHDRQPGMPTYSISRFLLSCWVLTTICATLLMFFRTGSIPSASEGGLAFMLSISGATTGLSALIDLIRTPRSTIKESNFLEDFLDDADGLALHRLQVAVFNFLVLFVVWRDMIQFGTVADIDRGWVGLLGASAMTFVFGKTGESRVKLIPDPVPVTTSSTAPSAPEKKQ